MLARLPYRIQIPLGLATAVLVAALLVTVVAAQIAARSAREATIATVDNVAALLGAQALPLLGTEDTWRAFVLVKNTAELLPGAARGLARAAILEQDGRVLASSTPRRLETGSEIAQLRKTSATEIVQPMQFERGGNLTFLSPIRSDDGQSLGFTYIEVDAPAFAPDWRTLSKPALIGSALAVTVLLPVGWWVGRRMTSPVVRLAQFIERIGRGPEHVAELRAQVPHLLDPELHHIGEATDRLLAEMQVRQRAEARAISAQRMAALGRLTAAVAHEINNPLGGLMNTVQVLNAHGDSPEVRKRSVDLLRRGLNQIQTTVATLLPQARIEARPFDLRDLHDVVVLAETGSHQTARISEMHRLEAPVKVPSALLRQVSLNLLLNACKAAGEQGSVRIDFWADEQHVTVAVCNDGGRLTPSQFQEVVDAESGNDPRGFGLWVCRELATQHSGTFAVDETYGQGTCLVFRIPNLAS